MTVMLTKKATLLDIVDLTVRYTSRRSVSTVAVDGVSLTIGEGETFGLVGESGSGKSSLARAIMGLAPIAHGSVRLSGAAIGDKSAVQMVFQDPNGSLDPRLPVAASVEEPLIVQRRGSRIERRKLVRTLLEQVGIPEELHGRRPRELSGGQRQRIAIARALALMPQLIVADEPVSALDVSVQAQVLNLFLDLQSSRDLALLFVSHDLAVVRHMSDRIGVMFRGRLVEVGPADEVVSASRHPYTRELLAAVPGTGSTERKVLKSPSEPVVSAGCAYAGRCALWDRLGRPAECTASRPDLVPVSTSHTSACHFNSELEST